MKLRTHWWDNFRFHIDDDVDFRTFGELDDRVDISDEIPNENKLYNQIQDITENKVLPIIVKRNGSYIVEESEKLTLITFCYDNIDNIDANSKQLVEDNKAIFYNCYDCIAAIYIIITILEKKDWRKVWESDFEKKNNNNNEVQLLHLLSCKKEDIKTKLHDTFQKLKNNQMNFLWQLYQPKDKEELRQIIEFVDSDFNLNWIDVSGLPDLSGLFRNLSFFNGDISLWNVSNATDMSEMFSGCTEFNGNLIDWTINTDNTENMFTKCNINDDYKPKINNYHENIRFNKSNQ